MTRAAAATLLASFLTACGPTTKAPPTPPPTPTPTPTPEPTPPPEPEAPKPVAPEFRLPAGARPTRVAVELNLDPDKDTFTGAVTISLELDKPTDILWLNATDLTINSAALVAGGKQVAVTPVDGGTDFAGFQFAQPAGPGSVRLRVEYSGKAPDENHEGVFRDQIDNRWYLFTQFEATSARRAFPCFDEPSFKVPWQVTIRAPEQQAVFSNTSETSDKPASKDGVATHVFRETPPLPSYLIAFAVGPFETVEAGQKPPMRIIVPVGHAAEANHAKKVVPELLAKLEEYFGTPYPYEKLDFIALPSFPGAMENVGLITFKMSSLIKKDEDWSPSEEREFASVAAHEMGHQWFGDLVTLAWWDDTWLNEAFATWIAAKVVDQWKPAWNGAISAAKSKEGALAADSLISARQVHNPADSQGAIDESFDSITYLKGAAVLSMFEQRLGADLFREGVRAYVAKHQNGNATSADFLASIGEAAKQDVTGMFGPFIDQPGVPLVSFELACEKKQAALKLTQDRYLPLGSTAEKPETWPVPVCVRADGGKPICTVLREKTGELPLGSKCPKRIIPNAGGVGYYRSQIPAKLLDALVTKLDKEATVPEALSLLGDVQALVASGHVQAGDVLALVPIVAKSKDRHILDATMGIAGYLAGGLLVPDDLRANFRRFVLKVYGDRARSVGWTGKKGEEEDTRLLRPDLMQLVALAGEDKALAEEAGKLARAWLDDPVAHPLDPEIRGEILVVAGRFGDQALYDRLMAAALKAEGDDQARLIAALGAFRDPKLAESARNLVLSDKFDLQASFAVIGVQFSDPEMRKAAYDWALANIDAVAGKIPAAFRGYLVGIGAIHCDEKAKAEFLAFFTEKAKSWMGVQRATQQTVERIDQCIASRAKNEASIRKFLEKY